MPPIASSFPQNVLQPLIDATDAVMVFIHDHVIPGGSWGLSIIGLTVVVRLILLPLTLKQFKSMQSLQRLQPEIKALQAKYKEDKQRLNQEMMKFYQENKVNPLGSCLPLLAQFPVFIALFYMLRTDLKLDICPRITQVAQQLHKPISSIHCDQVDPGSAKFLFIPDLTATAKGGVLITLIVLYIGSQIASSLLMTATADRNQRRLMLILPLIFVAFILSFPAGLIVYWITTNLWTMVQQLIVRRTVGPLKPPQPATAGAPAVVAGGGGDGSGAPAKPARSRRKRGGGGEAEAADGKPEAAPKRTAPPPRPPRKKKKRSGRRR
jgi:YidC/Oxa1 family membrane protein insertase